ncbi:putative uncharacterized protein WWC2-AS2 [Puma concolor]|uniref:Uncharacterized protein n=1 Tax=Puma concolor TaxID=9696 RepID=A0A6P6HK18_PUMCO|nr:putative uncharacterized protein WWC2-AS2 [Puma concolor]
MAKKRMKVCFIKQVTSGDRSSVDAEDGQGLPGPRHTRIPRTAPGERCGRLRGPGEPRPGVPTPLSHRGEGWGRLSGPQSSGVTWPSVLGSYANPWGPEGRGAAPCRCHLRHRSRSSRAWWAGQGRRSVPGWGRDPPGGGGPGPPQRQRQQRVFRLGRTVLRPAAWTLGPQGSPARPGKTTQLRRKRAGDQRGAYSPAPLAPAAPPQPAAAAAPRAHGCSAKGPWDPTRASRRRLQGAGESRREASWEM